LYNSLKRNELTTRILVSGHHFNLECEAIRWCQNCEGLC